MVQNHAINDFARCFKVHQVYKLSKTILFHDGFDRNTAVRSTHTHSSSSTVLHNSLHLYMRIYWTQCYIAALEFCVCEVLHTPSERRGAYTHSRVHAMATPTRYTGAN